jgi:hypothetical protein
MNKQVLLLSSLSLIALASCGGDANASKNGEASSPSSSSGHDEINPNKLYSDTDLLGISLSDKQPYIVQGDYVYFGEYPQTIKKANVTIDEADSKELKYGENVAFTCYKGNDGYYYAKVQSNTYSEEGYTFSDGTACAHKDTYYFQVLPLKWRILDKDYNNDGTEGDYLLLTDRVVDSAPFTNQGNYDSSTFYMTKKGVPANTPANSYEYSDVRDFVTNEFFNVALTPTQQALVKTVAINNSKETTEAKASESVTTCNTLNDKVFLLSYQDVHNTAYGFDSRGSYGDAERQLITSDYSRAIGDDIWPEEGYFFGMGIWWLRSAYPDNLEFASRVSSHGYTYFYDNAYKYNGGIAPALVINIK